MVKLILSSFALFLSICFVGCKKKEFSKNQIKSFPDWDAISNKLIEKSDLVKGEKVLLISKPGKFDPLVSILSEKINKTGAVYLGTFSVNSSENRIQWETEFINKAKGKSKKDLTNLLMGVDLGIMLPGATPSDIEYAAMQNVLKRNKGRTIHFHWSGAYNLSGEPIEINPKMNQFYQNVLLETDYQKLEKIQRDFEQAIRNKLINVTTPLGTNIKFKIGDRPVTKQDGNASSKREKQLNLIDREIELPAGAIRVAPIEDSVEGTIAFPNSIWNNKKVEGLVLNFKKGKVTKIIAEIGEEAVRKELDAAGDSGYSFREFALGFNPMLAIPDKEPWIPYYGYGAGVIRLSLGDNTELGGKVGGGYVRWNFFIDATVKAGEDTWVENGKLLK